jgi:hypothetical protein
MPDSANAAIVVAVISMLGTVANGAITAWSNMEISTQKAALVAVRQQAATATQQATGAAQQATTAAQAAQAAHTLAKENRTRLETLVTPAPAGPAHYVPPAVHVVPHH